MFCSNDVRIKLTLMIQNIITYNGLGIAEGRDLETESLNLAQMPNRSTKD